MPEAVIVIPELEKYGLCSRDCPFYDSGNWNCRAGWDGADRPGPSCPGPGRYRLVREE